MRPARRGPADARHATPARPRREAICARGGVAPRRASPGRAPPCTLRAMRARPPRAPARRPPARSTGLLPSRSMRALTLAALAAATWVAFSGVLRNGSILLDDPLYVFENPHVAGGVTAAHPRR